MYKLEDRILFDGAAAADVTDAQQEAEAQQQEAAEAEEAAQQEAAENAENADSSEGSESNSDSSTGGDSDDPGSLESVLAAIETANTGSDGQHIDVLVVSDSLENAEDIVNATSSDTIVVRYDARTTSAADLLQQITDALGGKLADTIGFATESGENAAVQLFADTDTSLDTVNNSVNQDFFHSLNNLMDEGAQLNLFASNLASTTEGTALVDAIGDAVDHDVAASIDETGSESAGGDWDLEYSTNDAGTDVSDVYFDENLIENFDSLLEDHVNHEIAFINSSIMNVDEVLAQLDPDIEVVMIEAGGDGLEQITDYLNEHSDIKYDAVHIITHGNEGYFNLSNSHVDSDFVQENSAELVQWRNALSDDADIMIYGCNLAESAEGRDLISMIASATGADIAASTDMVKNNDWSLEYNIGDINYGSLDILNYNHNLVDYTVTTIEDVEFSSKISLREAIELINAEGNDGGGTISFASVDKLGGTVVRLGSDAGYRDLSVTGNVTINGQISLGNNAYTYVNITRAAVSADTGQLEADRSVLETYTNNLDADIAAIQAAIDAVADPANPTYAEINAMRTAVNNAMGQTGPTSYDGNAAYTADYAALVEADGQTLVDTAEAAAPSSAYTTAAKAAQTLIDGYDALIASNWASAKAASTSFNTVAAAEQFVAWFTAMSTNSTAIYSPAATDPTDTIIDNTNNVAIITDTNPADHYRLITVSQGGNLTLINADLYGGYSDSAVTGGIAAGRGGAIYIAEGSSATLTNVDLTSDSRADASLFTANQASHEGGAIYNAGSLTINTDSSKYAGPSVWYGVSGNKAGTSGGGIYSTGDLSIEGPGVTSKFEINSNTATSGSGGGLYSEGTISLMHNVSFGHYSYTSGTASKGNSASEHGGGAYITSINDSLELNVVTFFDNSVSNGSGGGLAYVDSPGDLTIIQSDFTDNSAEVNGGAIYMENTGDFTFLGTQYISDQYQVCYENSYIYSNHVNNGEGGAFYLSRVGDVVLNSLDLNTNYGNNSSINTSLGGGAIKMENSGNLSIIDTNFVYNYFMSGNGAVIDYDGGTNGDKTLSITTSFFGYNGIAEISDAFYVVANNGTIYQNAGKLDIVNSTFNRNYAGNNGGAIWTDSSVTSSINFCTFVNNLAYTSGASIYVDTGSAVTGSISLTNTIIYNSSAPPSAQIVLPTGFDISKSSYNIFSHYYGYGASAQGLSDGTISATYLDESHNYVGTGSSGAGGSAYILSNIYISTTAVYTANYKTYTLALTNENSIAYRSGTNNGVTYDQRGNTRTVDPYGNAINASRGAFEPIFNLVVNSTEDTSNLLRQDPAGYYANLSWADGITLREAVYWIDSGDGLPNPTRGVISFNGAPGTTAKSGHNFYADGADNKIVLNGYQINIGQYRRGYSSDKTIIINGVASSQDASNRVIVDANNASRVFCLVDGTTVINHLTLENGNAPKGSSRESASGLYGGSTDGGAIYNYSGSTLTLNNVLVRNSTANAGDYKDTGYGGGIYNGGTLTLNDTTVTGNNAIAVADSNHVRTNGGHGGGIYNTGVLRLYRSTIDNNTTTGNAYVTESAKGGGIYNSNAYLYIENSTIAYNHNLTSASIATGGEGSAIYFNAGGSTLQLKNSTIAHNHTTSGNEGADWTLKSGVYVTAISTLIIENSILADNYVDIKAGDAMVGHWNDFYTEVIPVSAATTYNVVGFFNYGVYDFRSYSNNHVGAYLTDAGNPERGHVQDLYLNPTLDYRGGRTKVLSLLEGSLLLDLATNPGKDVTLASITNYMTGTTVISNPDQRGNTRTSGSYSIGSYQPIFAITVDLTTDEADTNHGWNWGGYTTENPPANAPGWTSDNSFRDAIYWIDPTGTISMGAAVIGKTITLNSELGQLLIEKSMTIAGAGITLQSAKSAGAAKYRVMYLDNPSHLSTTISVTLQNMTIQNGVDSYGGGIYNTANLTLEGVTVQNNETNIGYGGGIYSLGGSLSIGTYTGATTVYSNIIGNTAKTRGGGIYYEGQSTLDITQTNVSDNTATEGSGGGIYVTGANFTLIESTIGNNTAKVNGGGINSMSTDITMVNSTIANNTAGELGGGLAYFISGTLDMNFVTIANNISGTIAKTVPATTSLFGGGIYISAGTFNMTNSVVAQNYRTSISDSNRDDFYVGAYITTGTVSYNVFGKTENFTIPAANNVELGVTNPWTDLALDTELTDNGGPTMTLYVFNTDSVLQNGATPGSGAGIPTDQRGILRPSSGQPTIGAYQKSITSWVYIGDATATATSLATLANWRDATTGAVVTGDIIAPDRTLYFDPTRAGGIGTDNVTITESWDVNYKTSVVLDGTAHVTVAAASPSPPIILTAGLSVMGGSIFTVGSNASFVAATNTRVAISGAGSTINAGNTFTGTVDISAGTLKLNAMDGKLTNLTLGSLDSTSTVEYGYDGIQTVRAGTYGNLTISTSGTKRSNGNITASGTVTVSDSTFTLGGTLNTVDIALSNGTVSGASYAITSTGDVTSTGTSSISGGTLIFNTLSDYAGDISGSTVTIGGTSTLKDGTTHATGILTANGALTLNNADLTGGTGIVITNTITTTGTSGSPTTNTIKSSAITMDFSGSAAINVNDYSTLTFNTNAAPITLNTIAGNTANTFSVNDMTVGSNGSLEFLTTGNVTLDGITGTVADNIAGDLILRGYDITLNGAKFNNATLTLGNSNNLNIGTGGFTSVNSVIFDGIVNITGAGATITSSTGNLTFNNNIIGNGLDFNIITNASGGTGSVTVSTVTNAGNLVISSGSTATIGNISGSSLTVTAPNGIALDGTVNMNNTVTFNNAISVAGGATASITGNRLIISGAVTGAGNLSLGATGSTSSTLTSGVNLTGNLSLTDGTFTTGGDINSADLNISSPAELQMGTYALTTTGNLTNAGKLSSITGAVDVTGNLTNTNSFSAASATVTVGGDITNSGSTSGSTFTAGTVDASGNITNTSTGTMTISTLNLLDDSILSLNGTVGDFTLIALADGKSANLTNGNITTTTFTFSGTDSDSTFALASGTSLYVNTMNYNAGATYYGGNYFDTSGGGYLVQSVSNSAVEYRVGNSDSAIVINLDTLESTSGEKIGVRSIDYVYYNGGIVTGIEDTAGFTTHISRNWGGATTADGKIHVTENWNTDLEGDNFDPSLATNLFVLNGTWSDGENITVAYNDYTPQPTSTPIRREATYTLPHNGTYAFANFNANMTIPITNLNGNIALYEMSNPDFSPRYDSFYLDVDNITNFPIGTYPYFATSMYPTEASVGKAVYQQMEYRLVTNPLTNLLEGQVPPIGSIVGQAITKGASLTLTADAPVYLEVNGEYTIGKGWLPFGVPASAANIEQFQAPITQGQLDEFYLDFGGREGLFETPASFRSDLDEMIDDLLAG